MRCPKCGANNDKVIDSRSVREESGVRRRRECLVCGNRFTTMESIIPEELKVVKRSGVREPFNPDKLRNSIDAACGKRNIAEEQIDALVDEITRSLARDFDREVQSAEIGERVMAKLRNLDQVAYVRFASVYRKFQEVKDFIHEIKGLK